MKFLDFSILSEISAVLKKRASWESFTIRFPFVFSFNIITPYLHLIASCTFVSRSSERIFQIFNHLFHHQIQIEYTQVWMMWGTTEWKSTGIWIKKKKWWVKILYSQIFGRNLFQLTKSSTVMSCQSFVNREKFFNLSSRKFNAFLYKSGCIIELKNFAKIIFVWACCGKLTKLLCSIVRILYSLHAFWGGW